MKSFERLICKIILPKCIYSSVIEESFFRWNWLNKKTFMKSRELFDVRKLRVTRYGNLNSIGFEFWQNFCRNEMFLQIEIRDIFHKFSSQFPQQLRDLQKIVIETKLFLFPFISTLDIICNHSSSLNSLSWFGELSQSHLKVHAISRIFFDIFCYFWSCWSGRSIHSGSKSSVTFVQITLKDHMSFIERSVLFSLLTVWKSILFVKRQTPVGWFDNQTKWSVFVARVQLEARRKFFWTYEYSLKRWNKTKRK